jgi:hypothetical protein
VKVRFASLESLANVAADFHSDDVEPDLGHDGSESETDETQTQHAHGSVAIADRNLRICHPKYARFEVILFGGSWQGWDVAASANNPTIIGASRLPSPAC